MKDHSSKFNLGKAMQRIGWLFVLLGFLVPIENASADQVLRLARVSGSPDQMVASKILEQAYSRINIRIEFVDVPAKRALAMSSAGDLDGEVSRIWDVGREFRSLIPILPSINYIEPAAFTKSIDIEIAGWSSIRHYSVGIIRGVGSSEQGVNGMENIVVANSFDSLFNMLKAGRMDFAVTDLFGGIVILKQLKLDQEIRPLFPPIQKIEVYHFLNERHRHLVALIQLVLQDMKNSGELIRLGTSTRNQIIKETFKESLIK